MLNNNKGNVIIIGAGIAGLSAAYYLVNEGWQVSILEKDDGANNCSFGNAGMIVPSHFTPLAAPGIVAQGVKWMLDSKSPFYVRPSLNLSLIDWGMKFLKHANEKHVERNAEAIRDLNLESSKLYDQLASKEGFDFELRQNGILMLYKSKEVEHEEIELAEKASSLGLDTQVLDRNAVQALEPNLRIDTLGGVLYQCDGIMYPPKLMQLLSAYLVSKGVAFHFHTEVQGFQQSGHRIASIQTNKGEFKADEIVVTGGASLGKLGSKLNLKLPLMPGKGYSFMYSPDSGTSMIHAALLLEARVAVTPMNNQIRFSGTMELGPANDKIYSNRVKGIVESIPKYYPDLKVEYPNDVWFGYRPCSPDGLPYLGRTKKYSNVSIAGGGGMMGLSLGPAFGKSIAHILSGQSPVSDISGFSPDRFQ
ncbi:NAD(P)/FAD-dependent oxidoreductase [Sphingobacterium endophyticum]|uniref:NAD(P)/FAD-dependent oxidoreductase n=1 Tax=Sphingobacterium endophyticum TaxID=2546448 RepID=UPI0012E19012|nr:FAD-dependent oxidoreductase [Sphingobacterium endophyticum]